MMNALRIATRKSALAMWQARHVADLLKDMHPGIAVELVPVVTQGDRILDRPLAQIGGKGLFLKELEQALLSDRADLAVHSMKDVPMEQTAGLELEVVLPRATPFDGWIARDGQRLEETRPRARVGTSSLRRRCQLLAVRPDLEVLELRGNVDTRLSKLDGGEYDAIVLACAGLERLGMADRITQVLRPPNWLPAAAQGIIGLQCRSDDQAVESLIKPLHDESAGLQAASERRVATLLEGSCQVPLAVLAELNDQRLRVEGLVGTPDGSTLLRASAEGAVAGLATLAETVAEDLLAQGADAIIRAQAFT
jgi:hydroxymethylbilane synthase